MYRIRPEELNKIKVEKTILKGNVSEKRGWTILKGMIRNGFADKKTVLIMGARRGNRRYRGAYGKVYRVVINYNQSYKALELGDRLADKGFDALQKPMCPSYDSR